MRSPIGDPCLAPTRRISGGKSISVSRRCGLPPPARVPSALRVALDQSCRQGMAWCGAASGSEGRPRHQAVDGNCAAADGAGAEPGSGDNPPGSRLSRLPLMTHLRSGGMIVPVPRRRVRRLRHRLCGIGSRRDGRCRSPARIARWSVTHRSSGWVVCGCLSGRYRVEPRHSFRGEHAALEPPWICRRAGDASGVSFATAVMHRCVVRFQRERRPRRATTRCRRPRL